MPGPDRPADEGMVLNTRPREFIERYKEKNYLVRTRMVTEPRNALNPFTWKGVADRRQLSRGERRIIDEDRDFGMNAGFIIPIVTLPGSLSVFSPCGENSDFSPRARCALELSGFTANKSSNVR